LVNCLIDTVNTNAKYKTILAADINYFLIPFFNGFSVFYTLFGEDLILRR
jgi:hypothetical protein